MATDAAQEGPDLLTMPGHILVIPMNLPQTYCCEGRMTKRHSTPKSVVQAKSNSSAHVMLQERILGRLDRVGDIFLLSLASKRAYDAVAKVKWTGVHQLR